MRPWEVGRLTVDQIVGVYLRERDEHGHLVLTPAAADRPTERAAYVEFLWLNGIDDPKVQDRLWKAHQARRHAARPQPEPAAEQPADRP